MEEVSVGKPFDQQKIQGYSHVCAPESLVYKSPKLERMEMPTTTSSADQRSCTLDRGMLTYIQSAEGVGSHSTGAARAGLWGRGRASRRQVQTSFRESSLGSRTSRRCGASAAGEGTAGRKRPIKQQHLPGWSGLPPAPHLQGTEQAVS